MRNPAIFPAEIAGSYCHFSRQNGENKCSDKRIPGYPATLPPKATEAEAPNTAIVLKDILERAGI